MEEVTKRTKAKEITQAWSETTISFTIPNEGDGLSTEVDYTTISKPVMKKCTMLGLINRLKSQIKPGDSPEDKEQAIQDMAFRLQAGHWNIKDKARPKLTPDEVVDAYGDGLNASERRRVKELLEKGQNGQ